MAEADSPEMVREFAETCREALQAKLNPDSAAAKRIEARKVDKALADAKRKGTVLTGQPTAAASSNRSGAEFTKSSKFFANMQSSLAATGMKSGAGGKRKRGADAAEGGGGGGGEPSNKSAKFKL